MSKMLELTHTNFSAWKSNILPYMPKYEIAGQEIITNAEVIRPEPFKTARVTFKKQVLVNNVLAFIDTDRL